jgi:hypothetical protein
MVNTKLPSFVADRMFVYFIHSPSQLYLWYSPHFLCKPSYPFLFFSRCGYSLLISSQWFSSVQERFCCTSHVCLHLLLLVDLHDIYNARFPPTPFSTHLSLGNSYHPQPATYRHELERRQFVYWVVLCLCWLESRSRIFGGPSDGT